MNGLDGNGAGTGSTAVPGDEDDNYVQVNLSGGAGTAVYEVTADGGGAADDCDIPIAFVWGSGVELGSGTVSASLAPVSSVAGAHVDAGIPRFVPTVKTLEVINLEDCATTLLFPFVTNQADYDTGIAISNTSQDAFGTTENEGACTTYFYGSMMGGGAAPDAYTSDSVAAGGQLVFLLSRQAAGFQGYLMVALQLPVRPRLGLPDQRRRRRHSEFGAELPGFGGAGAARRPRRVHGRPRDAEPVGSVLRRRLPNANAAP